jgi:flagellar biosynthesis GTPase FlhF
MEQRLWDIRETGDVASGADDCFGVELGTDSSDWEEAALAQVTALLNDELTSAKDQRNETSEPEVPQLESEQQEQTSEAEVRERSEQQKRDEEERERSEKMKREEEEERKGNERRKRDEEEWSSERFVRKNMKNCIGCGWWTERVDGCKHMTCKCILDLEAALLDNSDCPLN